MGFGVSVYNDARGVLSNSGLSFSYAYSVPLGEAMLVRFGLSVGGSWNTIALEKLQTFGSDPALANALNQNASIIGNAGVSVHLKSFHLGVSMPHVFSPAYVSPDAFTITEVRPFQSLIIQASNRFYLSDDKVVFEPYAVYRINTGLPFQYELAGVIHVNHLVWLGGSYKQEFGISAFGGVRINSALAAGGSYTVRNTGDNKLNFPSFDVNLSYHFANTRRKASRKKKEPFVPVYSFVDTEKPKAKRVNKSTPAQVAAEKLRQAELAKKKVEAERLAEVEKAEAERKKAELAQEEAAQKKAAELEKQHAEELRVADSLLHAHRDDLVTQGHDSIPPAAANERHEVVERGDHVEELVVNHYVIVGVFGSVANAKKFAVSLQELGFKAHYGHLTIKNLWYVHVFQDADINVTRSARDEFRKFKVLQNAWLLTVQDSR